MYHITIFKIANRQEAIQERMGDALALRGDEGRDKLRKAAGIGTYELIRRYPNGATHYVEDIVFRVIGRQTRGTETSKYPEEEKTKVIP